MPVMKATFSLTDFDAAEKEETEVAAALLILRLIAVRMKIANNLK